MGEEGEVEDGKGQKEREGKEEMREREREGGREEGKN